MGLITLFFGQQDATTTVTSTRRRYVDDPLYAVAIGNRLPMNMVSGDVDYLQSEGIRDGDLVLVNDDGNIYLCVYSNDSTSWKKILLSTAHNDLTDKQGGTTGEYYHLTAAEHTAALAVPTTYLKLDCSNDPLTGSLESSSTISATNIDGNPTELKLSTASKGGVFNGGFESAPAFTAPTTAGSRWIDGTAGGSTTDSKYGWGNLIMAGTGNTQFDPTVKRTGNYSLKLNSTEVTGGVTVGNYANASTSITREGEYIKIKPSTVYKWSAWVKTFNAYTNGVYIDFRQLDASAVTITTTSSNKLTGTNDWTYLTGTVTTSASAVYCVFVLRLNPGATTEQSAWFDDVKLEEVISDTTFTGKIAEKARPVLQAVTSVDNIDQSLDTGGAYVNTYTTPTTVSETATNRQTFTPTKENMAMVGFYIVNRGTGNLTLRIHNSSNVSLFASTLYNAVTADYRQTVDNAWNYFTIPAKLIIGTDYHFHLTSSVADCTIKTNTAGDMETCSYIEYYAKNSETLETTINGVKTQLKADNITGFLPQQTFDLDNGKMYLPFLQTRDFTVQEIRQFMAMYSYFPEISSALVLSSTSNFSGNARLEFTSIIPADIYVIKKINTVFPIKSTKLRSQIYTNGASRIDISPDGINWTTIREAQTDGSPSYVSRIDVTNICNGYNTIYLRYYKVTTSSAYWYQLESTTLLTPELEVDIDTSSVPTGLLYPIGVNQFTETVNLPATATRAYFRLNKFTNENAVVMPAIEFTDASANTIGFVCLKLDNSTETNPSIRILSTTTNYQASGTGSSSDGYILNNGEYMTFTSAVSEIKIDYQVGAGTTTFSNITKNIIYSSSNGEAVSSTLDQSLQQQVTIGVRQQGLTGRVKDIGEDLSTIRTAISNKHSKNLTIRSISASATLTADDEVVICDNASSITVTLPFSTGSGKEYFIKSVGAGSVVIDGNASETIDGETTQTINSYDSANIVDYLVGKWAII